MRNFLGRAAVRVEPQPFNTMWRVVGADGTTLKADIATQAEAWKQYRLINKGETDHVPSNH